MKIRLILFFLLLSLAVAAQSGPEVYNNDIRNFARQDSISPPAPGMILFVGSSTFTKWKDVQSYFPGHRILNRGFGGTQFSDLLYWADKVIYPYKPAQIIIYEGDNDLAAGKSPEEILQQAKQLRKRIAENLPGVPVIFISPKPSIARWNLKDKYIALNASLKHYAKKAKKTKFIDMWPHMLDASGQPLPIFEKDNLHMTAEGYKIWAPVIEPYLGK